VIRQGRHQGDAARYALVIYSYPAASPSAPKEQRCGTHFVRGGETTPATSHQHDSRRPVLNNAVMEMEENQQIKGLEQLGFGRAFRDTLCDMLEETQIFRSFERAEIELLADYVQAWRAPPKTVLFIEGKRDGYLCILVEGKLEVFKEADGRGRRHLASIRAGKTIGEMSIIDEQPHSATVISSTEVTLLTLTKGALARIADQQPKLAYKVIWQIASLLSARLRQTSGMLVDRLG